LVDANGAVVERCLYDAYGSPTICDANWTAITWSNSRKNEVLYCGYRYDPETGNYHVRNRFLIPPLGRWGQVDPLGYHDSPNLYQYVRGWPTRSTDCSGLGVLTWNIAHTPFRWEEREVPIVDFRTAMVDFEATTENLIKATIAAEEEPHPWFNPFPSPAGSAVEAFHSATIDLDRSFRAMGLGEGMDPITIDSSIASTIDPPWDPKHPGHMKDLKRCNCKTDSCLEMYRKVFLKTLEMLVHTTYDLKHPDKPPHTQDLEEMENFIARCLDEIRKKRCAETSKKTITESVPVPAPAPAPKPTPPINKVPVWAPEPGMPRDLRDIPPVFIPISRPLRLPVPIPVP
jgi:RHS repeat-associated protein